MRIFQPTVTGSNTTTGSLHISGPVYFYTLETSSTFHVLTYNTSSGQVFFTGSDAFKGVPDDPLNSIQFNNSGNFSGSSNLTFDNNVVYLTGSSITSGSITLTGSLNTSGSIILTGSFSVSGSTNIIGTSTITGSLNTSGSTNTIGTSIITGSLLITGSTTLTGSMFVSGAISASFGTGSVGFYGTASWAQSSSFALTAAAAPEDTYVQYNKNRLFGAEQYFRYIYNSHSLQQGDNVIASGSYQTVIGKYNISSTSQSAFIIGDGGTLSPVFFPELLNYNITTGDSVITVTTAYFSIAPGLSIKLINNTTNVDEIFEITDVVPLTLGDYTVTLNGNVTQNYTAFSDEFDLLDILKHNLLFASQSWFEVSASNVFLQGLPEASSSSILMYDTASGQVFYTASTALQTSPAPQDTWIQYNSASKFGASQYFRYKYNINAFQHGASTALGSLSHAEGLDAVAFGGFSHAEGSGNTGINDVVTGSVIGGNKIEISENGNFVGSYWPGDSILVINIDTGYQEVITIQNSSFNSPKTFITASQTVDAVNVYMFGLTRGLTGGTLTANGYPGLGDSAHAEGRFTYAMGTFSHAEGDSTIAFGNASHTDGLYTTAIGPSQTVVGSYNIPYISTGSFIIGDGILPIAQTGSLPENITIGDTIITIPITFPTYFSGSLIGANLLASPNSSFNPSINDELFTISGVSIVGNNFEISAGMCGSVSGSIPASVGQAALKVDEILVGGAA